MRLQRLPALSLGLALVLLLSFPVVELGFASRLSAIHDELRAAVDFAIRNPMVQIEPRLLPVIRGVLPSFDSNEIFDFLKRGARTRQQKQQAFDQLVWQGFESLDRHPYRRLGLVPASPSLLGLAAHPLVHVGAVHLLGAVLLLLAAGPLLERGWGRGPFAAALLAPTLLGAAAFCLVHRGADRALLGAGAPVAGLVAAVVVRFWGSHVDWLHGLWSGRELRTPVWTLAVAWLLYEASLALSLPGALPRGVDTALGYTAHGAGALAGVLIALAVRRLGLEQRWGRRAETVVVEKRTAAPRFDFERVRRLRERGEADAAFALLEQATRRSARHRDAVTAFWQMAVERGQPRRAAPALIRLVAEELRRGAVEHAVAHWRELAEHLPDQRLDPATLIRLFPVARRVAGDEHAILALQQAMDATAQPPSAHEASEIARLAADLDEELALAAAECALRDADLDPARRAELEAIASRSRKSEGPGGVPVAELPPNAFYDEQDRSGFGDVGDLSEFGAAGEVFPRTLVAGATPVVIDDAGVFLEVEGAPDVRLDYASISVVAVSGVHGLGRRPVVVVDLFAAVPAAGDAELRIYRLRCDRFDPRGLVPEAGSPLVALRALLELLLERSQARPLPDPNAARANPVRIFDSLDAYEAFVATRLDGLVP